jgi:hypothetical protein
VRRLFADGIDPLAQRKADEEPRPKPSGPSPTSSWPSASRSGRRTTTTRRKLAWSGSTPTSGAAPSARSRQRSCSGRCGRSRPSARARRPHGRAWLPARSFATPSPPARPSTSRPSTATRASRSPAQR